MIYDRNCLSRVFTGASYLPNTHSSSPDSSTLVSIPKENLIILKDVDLSTIYLKGKVQCTDSSA